METTASGQRSQLTGCIQQVNLAWPSTLTLIHVWIWIHSYCKSTMCILSHPSQGSTGVTGCRGRGALRTARETQVGWECWTWRQWNAYSETEPTCFPCVLDVVPGVKNAIKLFPFYILNPWPKRLDSNSWELTITLPQSLEAGGWQTTATTPDQISSAEITSNFQSQLEWIHMLWRMENPFTIFNLNLSN